MRRFQPPATLETAHCIARPAVVGDAEQAFAELFSNREVMRYLPVPRHETLEQTRQHLLLSEKGWETGTLFRWSVLEKHNQALYAQIDLLPALPRVEIGVLSAPLRSFARRRSLAYFGNTLIKWMDQHPDVYRIFACCAVGGQSASMMPKFGFELDCVMRGYDARPNNREPVGDTYLFSRVRRSEPIDTAGSDWLDGHIVW